jgi:uncharacterized membrane protein YhaH (DUF805 family)
MDPYVQKRLERLENLVAQGQLSRTDFNNARDVLLAEAGQSTGQGNARGGADRRFAPENMQSGHAAPQSTHRIPGGYDANGSYTPSTVALSSPRGFGRAGLAGQSAGFGGATTLHASPISQSPRYAASGYDNYRDAPSADAYETPPSLLQVMVAPILRFGDFSGRSSRHEYWCFYLLHIIVGMVCGMMAVVSLPVAMLVGLGYLMLTFIPNLSVSARRLHDQDKSGWFYLLCFIPLIGGLIVMVMMASAGTKGPNRYGEEPA